MFLPLKNHETYERMLDLRGNGIYSSRRVGCANPSVGTSPPDILTHEFRRMKQGRKQTRQIQQPPISCILETSSSDRKGKCITDGRELSRAKNSRSFSIQKTKTWFDIPTFWYIFRWWHIVLPIWSRIINKSSSLPSSLVTLNLWFSIIVHIRLSEHTVYIYDQRTTENKTWEGPLQNGTTALNERQFRSMKAIQNTDNDYVVSAYL